VEKHNPYFSVNSLNLSPFQQYKYLTENDEDIVLFKHKIKGIEIERNLSSFMNDSKWIELQIGIEKLPFPPAYNVQLIHSEKREPCLHELKNEPSFFGDWSSYWEEGLPIFFTIEWMEIRPKHRKRIGRLVPDIISDESNELLALLDKLNISFQTINGSVFIYGYK
jgi:hypothetical protein